MIAKEYLPSKKFVYIFIACVIVLVIFLLVSNIFFGKNSFVASDKKGGLQGEKVTLNSLLQKDSDGDGVMDWEEALWGTDPNKEASFDGISDSEYIKNKRAELKLSTGSEFGQGEGGLSETDKFAQEFFASLSAMKQGGQIDEDTIKNVSASLGQNIVDPTMTDKYTENDIQLDDNDGVDRQEVYYLNAQKLFEQYKKEGLGDELEITGQIVSSQSTMINDPDSINKLLKIADAYQAYAQEMTKTPVPQSLAQYHLQIINSANNTGIAVRNMSKVVDDPIVGLSGLSQYQKYSEDLISSVEKLETILSNNGIIIE
jgi:hypothetical protein